MTETLAGRFAARERSRGYVPAPASAVPAAAAALGIAALGAANGGYFPEAWSWGLLICVWILMALVITSPAFEFARLDGVLMGALAGLAVVTLVSGTWGSSSLSLLEGQRSTFYAALAAACLVLVRRRTLGLPLGGSAVGVSVISGYSLLERVEPDRFGKFDPVAGYRLAGTIGYWNGLGIFAAIGILLSLGFAARGRSLAVRALAAASLVVLAPTLYFTFSRGASIVLAVGLLAAIALDPRRLQLIVTELLLAPAPALAVLVASRSDALTHEGSRLAAAVHEGHRLALVVALLAAAAAVVAIGLGLAERRIVPRRGGRLAFAGAVGRATDWAPWSAQPWKLLGEAQLGAGNVAAAERSFRHAIGKDPGDLNLYFDLARATTARVQFAALAAASRLNPRSPEIAEFRRELAAQPAITVGGGS